MERFTPTPEEVSKRIDGAQSQQDMNYWEDIEQYYVDQEIESLPIDHEGRPKIMRAGDSNIERHLDNLSIFTGWIKNQDGSATYYRSGVPCYNKKSNQ